MMEQPLLLSIPEAGKRLGVKDSSIKKLIREGQLLSVKIGDRRLVPLTAIDDYVRSLVLAARRTGYTPGTMGGDHRSVQFRRRKTA